MVDMRFDNFWKNLLHDMAYHVRTCLCFKPNDQSHGHIYFKVYDNVPIFGRWVHICMVNNVYDGSLQLLWTKEPFSIFKVAKLFFVKEVWKIWPRMRSPQFSHKVDHVLWIIPKLHEFSSFLACVAHLNDFMSIYWNWVKFELQVRDRLLLNFAKNSFKVPK